MFAAIEDIWMICLIVKGQRDMAASCLAMPHLPHSSLLTGKVVVWLLQCARLLAAKRAS